MEIKYKLQILKKESKRLEKKIDKIIKEINNDPVTIVLNCHLQLSEFLEKHKGKERTSEKALKEFELISKAHDAAEKRIPKYNSGKLHDDLLELQMKQSDLNCSIASIGYRERMRNELLKINE